MMLNADETGYVAATIPGLAVAACIGIEDAREAIRLFESPDPDSRTEDHEGRRIVRHARGWLLINFVAHRERAKLSAERARKRAWAKVNRPSPSVHMETDVDEIEGSVEKVDAPKPKLKLTPPKKGERSPPPPEAGFTKGRISSGGPCPCGDQERPGHPIGWCHQPSHPQEAQGTPLVFRTLQGWHPSPELRAEALVAGVIATEFDRRVAELRNRQIGGAGGVLDRDEYIRNQFGRWRTWAETDRAKAQADLQRPGSGGGRRPAAWEPGAKHVAFAEQHGLPLAELLADFSRRGYTLEHYPEKDLGERFGRLLARERGRRGKGAAA